MRGRRGTPLYYISLALLHMSGTGKKLSIGK